MPTLCGSRPRGVSDRRGESAENVAGWMKVLEIVSTTQLTALVR